MAAYLLPRAKAALRQELQRPADAAKRAQARARPRAALTARELAAGCAYIFADHHAYAMVFINTILSSPLLAVALGTRSAKLCLPSSPSMWLLLTPCRWPLPPEGGRGRSSQEPGTTALSAWPLRRPALRGCPQDASSASSASSMTGPPAAGAAGLTASSVFFTCWSLAPCRRPCARASAVFGTPCCSTRRSCTHCTRCRRRSGSQGTRSGGPRQA